MLGRVASFEVTSMTRNRSLVYRRQVVRVRGLSGD
jgi:hypothetical protein